MGCFKSLCAFASVLVVAVMATFPDLDVFEKRKHSATKFSEQPYADIEVLPDLFPGGQPHHRYDTTGQPHRRKLQVTIPLSCALRNCRGVAFKDCDFTGCQDLQYLDLHDLTGTLPEDLKSLTNLKALYVGWLRMFHAYK